MSQPSSYAEAIVSAQQIIREGRLADQGEHYPYKHDVVTALVEENPPMGPDGPDDDRLRAEDFTSQEIADATQAYVAAQEAYLRDPGDATKADYVRARDRLQQARAAHRVNRGGSVNVVGIRARRAGE